MKKLHSFILKSYIGPFVLTFFIAQFLLLMQFLWKYIDDLVGKGLDVVVISELLMYASASLVPMALPLAILLSSIMTFGNLAEHNELMAIKSAGVNLFKIMYPLMVLVFFISIGAFFFSNYAMPYTNLKMGVLLYDVRKQKPEVSIKEGVFNDLLDGFVIKVSKKNKNTSMLYDIMIYDHRDNNGNRKVTLADSATMNTTTDNHYMVLTLYNGTSYDEVKEKKKRRKDKEYPHQKTDFTKQRILIDMSGLDFKRTDENLFRNNYQMLNLKQLEHAVDSLHRGIDIRKKQFVTNLETKNYFKKLNKSKRDSNWYERSTVDSLNSNISIDSLFTSLSYEKKILVFSHAKNYVRSTQSFITASLNELRGKAKWVKRHEIEWHRKFTLSFACLLLFFIGAPLGAIIRKGGLGMPVVVSVLFFVVYYVITITGEKYARLGDWPPWLGMWISAMILFPLGLFLTYKAAADAPILDIHKIIRLFKRIVDYFKKLRHQPNKKTV